MKGKTAKCMAAMMAMVIAASGCSGAQGSQPAAPQGQEAPQGAQGSAGGEQAQPETEKPGQPAPDGGGQAAAEHDGQEPPEAPGGKPLEKPEGGPGGGPGGALGDGPAAHPGQQGAQAPQGEEGDSFQASLFSYARDAMEGKDFMISPMSLRAALCLAIEGADGKTLDGLLSAAGFADRAGAEAWYKEMAGLEEKFAAEVEAEAQLNAELGVEAPGRAFSIADSIWNNTDLAGSFTDAYKEAVREKYGAAVEEADAGEITGRVNAWCGEETGGMIKEISPDLSRTPAVLANALYFKSAWEKAFPEGGTHEGTFTAASGERVGVTFMEQQDRFSYFEDGDAKMVLLGLEGQKGLAMVLGERTDIGEMLASSKLEEVHVVMPKMEISSTFGVDILGRFLMDRGAGDAFDEALADFSPMSGDVPWHIGDIIQKTKLKADEEGLEAAAVSAIMMAENAAQAEEPEVKEFVADRPFTFHIIDLSGQGQHGWEPPILFSGQCAEGAMDGTE